MNTPHTQIDVMILAAGRGERLRPLTDTVPKPLIEAGGKTLMEHHLHALIKTGVGRVIINTAHLAQKIHKQLGDGSQYGIDIVYSDEPETALETAGGLVHALPLMQSDRVLAINGDIYTDYDFARLVNQPKQSVHLVLVDNPPHHPDGDFALLDGQAIRPDASNTALTFSGIGIYSLEILRSLTPGRRALAPLLFNLIDKQQITGEHHTGKWTDVGTIERLEQLRAELASNQTSSL